MKKTNLILGIGILFLLVAMPVAHASVLSDLWYWIVGDSIDLEDKMELSIQHNWYSYPHYAIKENCYVEQMKDNKTGKIEDIVKSCQYNDINLTADNARTIIYSEWQEIRYNGYIYNTSNMYVWCWQNKTTQDVICISTLDGAGSIHKEMMPTDGMSYFIINADGITKTGYRKQDFSEVKK